MTLTRTNFKPTGKRAKQRRARVSQDERKGYNAVTVGKRKAKQLTRRIGLAQPAVLAVLKLWFAQRGMRNPDIAVALGLMVEGATGDKRVKALALVRKQLSGGVALPEPKAEDWGKGLGQNRHEREAVADLIALANAHQRVLNLLGDWQAEVKRLGRVLLSERRRQ